MRRIDEEEDEQMNKKKDWKKKNDDNSVIIKVLYTGYKGQLSFKISRNDTFEKLIQQICAIDKKKPEDLRLTYDGLNVSTKNTPRDFEMESGDTLKAQLIQKVEEEKEDEDENNDENKVEDDNDGENGDLIRLQLRISIDDGKPQSEIKKYRIRKTDKFEKFFDVLKKDFAFTKLKLKSPDGENLLPNQTPNDHDLEDEDLLDAIISN